MGRLWSVHHRWLLNLISFAFVDRERSPSSAHPHPLRYFLFLLYQLTAATERFETVATAPAFEVIAGTNSPARACRDEALQTEWKEYAIAYALVFDMLLSACNLLP